MHGRGEAERTERLSVADVNENSQEALAGVVAAFALLLSAGAPISAS